MMHPVVSRPGGAFRGRVGVPGDKSISHRAVLLGACAVGETRIRGLLEAEDVKATISAMGHLGAEFERVGGSWRVGGRGIGGLREPSVVLDMGNSGTAARLLLGLAAGLPFTVFLTGDRSLSQRPMQRVIDPLTRMGACFVSRSGQRLPVAVRGCASPTPIEYVLPVASAQVKSAILLAGLGAAGRTTVIEPQPTRDHMERMLSHFGAKVDVDQVGGGGRRISIAGLPELTGCDLSIPGDFSSAAFLIVGALITEGSRLTLEGIGLNEGRTGLVGVLKDMGGNVSITGRRQAGGEPAGDIMVEAGQLNGVTIAADRVPSMIDEFPILAVAAACAQGETHMTGLAELRVKESDRLSAIARGLRTCGVDVVEGEDWLRIRGCGGPPVGGADIRVDFDHRIAMAFLVLGAAARNPVRIDDASPIDTSFPGFVPIVNDLGLHLEDA